MESWPRSHFAKLGESSAETRNGKWFAGRFTRTRMKSMARRQRWPAIAFAEVETRAEACAYSIWSGPTIVGDGTSPVSGHRSEWAGGPRVGGRECFDGAQSVQGSLLPPRGSGSSPAILNDAPGNPIVVMDRSGNALAMWATPGSDDDSAVQTSTLSANSTIWTSPPASSGKRGRRPTWKRCRGARHLP
jgi:hypothetical protein